MRTRKILLILTSVALYTFAVLFCRAAKDDANRTYLLLSKHINSVQAEDIFNQEAALADSVGFCFWGEKMSQRVSCKETSGVSEVTLVFLSGNPELMDASQLTWQDGCLLDEDTAHKLFGTSNCSEQVLWCEGRPYRVFETMSAPQPTMVTIANVLDGSILDHCVLQVTPEQGRREAEQFLMRWGLTGETIDFYPLWAAVYDLLLIVPGILLIESMMCALKRYRILSFPYKMQPIICLAVNLALFILLCSQIMIPPDMIPSRWSDFSFWEKWVEGQKENFQLVLRTPMGERHLQMMLDMVKSILSSTAAILLTMWILRREKHADTSD